MSSGDTPRSTRITALLYARLGVVVTVVAAITGALLVPFLAMAPDESASTEPSGDVFTARDSIDDRFVSSVHATFVIAEHETGDLLTSSALADLLDANQAVRDDPTLGPNLLRYFEADAGLDAVGILGLAELVDLELRAQGIDGIGAASDQQVKDAGAALIDQYGERSDLLGISALSARNADGQWVVPAVNFPVLADNDVLGFGNVSVNLGGDTDVEEYDREVQEVLRTAPGYQINGVAIDVNLTSEEQGAVAGPFIGFTILAALVLVGLTFRSYWVMATVSVAFLALIVWLKGISNLIGLRDDLVLALIVPIAMVSFGVDFAFHAIGRYREERATGRSAAPAVVGGLAAVSGALVLALISDGVAFLANVTAGIESIIGFGVGAAIALASAFLLLGVVTPLVVARIEADVAAPKRGRTATLARVGAGFGAASMTMASVLLLVFVLPWLGAIVALVTALAILAVPYRVARNRRTGPAVGDLPVNGGEAALARPIGGAVAGLAKRPVPVLAAAVAVTAIATVFAVQVPAAFDVEDFFSPDTDFVVGLDQLDTHVGDRGGEPAIVYIEGDLADPESLAALATRVDEIRSLDTPALARDDAGRVDVDAGIFAVFDATWESPVMVDIVAAQTGVALTDENGDGIPDTRAQVEALVGTTSTIGVVIAEDRVSMTPDDVATVVELDGVSSATILEMQVVDSRAQESVAAVRDTLDPIAEAMSTDLGGTFVQVTGSPIVREASLDATNRALQVSLPIAVLLCLLVASGFLRSVRYGLASIVPILMVVAWLYAFMEIAGYSINLVTATIAAVSIGIGIDFAIHFIARYREELERHGRRHTAVRVTGEGTGVALVASALSSAVGFGILAFAPMPLFASYGLLTALMIVMALVATLAVLPSILVLVTRDRSEAGEVDGGHERRVPLHA